MDKPKYWILKNTQVGAPQWLQAVQISLTCPDQRKYRRLTWAERELFERSYRK